jgi:multiple sugar transport system permease protein
MNISQKTTSGKILQKWSLTFTSLAPFTLLGRLSERRYWSLLLIMPSLILILALILYPVTSGIAISLQDVRLNRPDRTGFIGITHYLDLLKDRVFLRALGNTLVWVVNGIASQFLLGLVAALALNRPLRGMKLARILVVVPWILPTVVAGNVWALMLDSRLGVINDVLVKIGILSQYKAWFADPNTAFPMVQLVALWQGFPFFTLLLLAGLQGIPDDLYEAAAVDGANRWYQFIHITLPSLRPIIVAVVVLRVIGLVNSPDLLIILTKGGPGHATEVLSSYAFVTAYAEFNYGYAAAISVVMLVLLMVFTIIYVRVSRVNET